jgi:DNA-binding CsgD family transcriptional regulator
MLKEKSAYNSEPVELSRAGANLMLGKNVHYTFEEVIKEMDQLETSDLMGWMTLICKHYLSERDIVILEALKAKTEGKYKQRELSVLFAIAQPHLSDNFRRIRLKILNLYNFLQCDNMVSEYFAAKVDLTKKQYSLLQLAMAGNSFYDIAKVEQVSNPDVSIMFKTVLAKLEATKKYPYLVKFLYRYKGKFIKN